LISINASELSKKLAATFQTDSTDANFILEFRRIAFFDPLVIEKMIQTAYLTGSVVIANNYNNARLVEMTENGSVDSFVAYSAPLLVMPKTVEKSGFKNFRMRTDARCIEVGPSKQSKKKLVVTTIIRFHKSANFNELKNALYCLVAMIDCVVIPLIATQDLSKKQIEELENTINDIPWKTGFLPQIHCYESKNGDGDLRSKMLNESLRKVTTRYAAFLDFDDLLMPHAYSWLINRLEKTGKAVSFGRVYATSYDSATGVLMDRKREYEYGYSYEEFVQHNHAPLHSFMLDLERLDLSHVIFFEDQRYMEDYLLTLQLFTQDNCDWESLGKNCYIGDYIHSIDRSHTLAFLNEQERQAMLSDPDYMVCEQRIKDMRCLISTKNQYYKGLGK
jgi:O-antigen biosynthesis protein